MNLWMAIGGGLLAGGLALAWWRLQSLATKTEQCVRRQYYDRSALQDAVRQQSDALAILRLQLAQVAAGTPVDDALVRAGCLYREVSAEDARRMMPAPPSETSADCVIVDVRSHKEFLASRLPGARHVPLEELETRGLRDVPADAATVLVYCSQGERSRLACDFLSRQGYMNLVTIRDGLQSWTGPVLGTGNAALIQIQPPGKPDRSTVEPAEHRQHG